MDQVVTRFKQPKGPRKAKVRAAAKRPGMSPEHLGNIRKLPSCVSGKHPCEAHHLRIKSERGVGLRATDKWAVPLTWDEHLEVHKVGSRKEDGWFKARGIANVYELASALWFNRGLPEEMERVIDAHRAALSKEKG